MKFNKISFEKLGSSVAKSRFEKWYSYILFLFVGFIIADLTILSVRDLMLPTEAPPARPPKPPLVSDFSRGSLNTITARNIFSSDGMIPDAIVPKGKKDNPNEPEKELPPEPTSLPLNLMGTLVHSNPVKSIATIELKGKNKVLSYSPKRDIENLATVISIERHKVIIRNKNNNRLEYIEMKDTGKMAFGLTSSSMRGPEEKGDVVKTSDNQFALKRSDLLKYTKDLSSILQQARAVPSRDEATGVINGYKLLDIQPGSVYEQLGLQRMDVIKSVNGENVDSPARAMELYNQLKNSNGIKLSIERNGKTEDLSYTIK
jgi:general secretion pathway protein C